MSNALPIEIFCYYAQEDQMLLQKLTKHLMPLQWQGLITVWSDTNIEAGTEREREIEAHLNAAKIVLFLISSDFMVSEYYNSEVVKKAIERREQGDLHLIPVLLRFTHWEVPPFKQLQAIPRDGKPIQREEADLDEMLYNVVEQIGHIVRTVRIQELSKEALHHYAEQHYAEALLLYDQLINLEPNDAAAHLKKGHILLRLGKYEECLLSFERAIMADKNLIDADFYAYKAYALGSLQRIDESLDAYDAAIYLCHEKRADIMEAILYERKAYLFLSKQRYIEALDMYNQSNNLFPQARIYAQLGEIHEVLEQLELAIEMYQEAINIAQEGESKVHIYYQKKGQILFQLKRFKDALETYEILLSFAASDKNIIDYLQKGKCLLELQEYETALNVFEERIGAWAKDSNHAIDPHIDPYIYQGKGKALLGLDRYEEALQAFDKAIQLTQPHIDPEFYRNKGSAYQGLANQAFELAEQRSTHWNTSPLLLSPINQDASECMDNVWT